MSKVEKYELSPEAYDRRQSTECMGWAGRGMWGPEGGGHRGGHHRLGGGAGSWRMADGEVGQIPGR